MENDSALLKLSQICAEFFKNQNWQSLIQMIVRSGIEVTNADRGTVFLAPDLGEPERANSLTSFIATGVDGRILNILDQKGVAGYVFREQVPLIIPDVRKDSRFYNQIDKEVGYDTRNILCVPLRIPWGKPIGCLELLNKPGSFNKRDLEITQILAHFASLALEHRYTIHQLESRNEFLAEEKNNQYDQIKNPDFLLTNNPVLRNLFKQLPMYAESDSNVLISGESGTGKELIARYLHQNSPRRTGPFVAVNCSAIPENLIEAELFGVAEGAATGTVARKGKVEMASHGTLFLDEIGEMPLAMQSKLLRVLQDKMVAPVGSDQTPKYVDFRLVSATNRNLIKMMDGQEFREDLYYRLSVLNVHLLPLRERVEDLESICLTIVNHFSLSRGWKTKSISPQAMAKLKAHHWPGNIRELQNRLEYAFIVSGKRREILPEDIDFQMNSTTEGPPAKNPQDVINSLPEGEVLSLKEAKDRVEKMMIIRALKKTNGNKVKAGEILDLSREGLRKAMKRHRVA